MRRNTHLSHMVKYEPEAKTDMADAEGIVLIIEVRTTLPTRLQTTERSSDDYVTGMAALQRREGLDGREPASSGMLLQVLR